MNNYVQGIILAAVLAASFVGATLVVTNYNDGIRAQENEVRLAREIVQINKARTVAEKQMQAERERTAHYRSRSNVYKLRAQAATNECLNQPLGPVLDELLIEITTKGGFGKLSASTKAYLRETFAPYLAERRVIPRPDLPSD